MSLRGTCLQVITLLTTQKIAKATFTRLGWVVNSLSDGIVAIPKNLDSFFEVKDNIEYKIAYGESELAMWNSYYDLTNNYHMLVTVSRILNFKNYV